MQYTSIQARIIYAVSALTFIMTIVLMGPCTTPKIHYMIAEVERGDIEQNILAMGEIIADQLVIVGSQASGQIKKLYVTLGQKVKKGELILEIDSTTQVNELNANRADLETYKAQLISKEITLKIAEQVYTRALKLKTHDATSLEDFEEAENTLAQAKADVAELKCLITKSQIAVNIAETNLSYTKIVAPMEGTVISLPIEEGQTINSSQTTPVIARLADLNRLQVKIKISEGDVTKVTPGMPVSFKILSDPKAFYETTLQSVDPASTILSDASQEEIQGTNSEKAIYYYGKLQTDNVDGKLRIGMTTQNTIHIASAKNAVRVPNIAIHERANEKYVLIQVAHKTPVERMIITGISNSMYTEVLSGLEVGEMVVTSQMDESEINASINNLP